MSNNMTEATAVPQAVPQAGSGDTSVGNHLNGGIAGGEGGGVGTSEHAPSAPISGKEAKTYTKLLEREGKNDDKELSSALKSASSEEKAMRKAQKAEAQSIKRHQKAVKEEHKASKALIRAKEAQEKAAAVLQKAKEELDIKKNHTSSVTKSYDNVKAKIDEHRNAKIANDKDRARRQASMGHTQ